MAVELTDAVNGDGLFDLLGKAFFAQSTIETAVKTTIADEVVDIIEQFKKRAASEAVDDTINGVIPALDAHQAGAIALQNAIQSYCQQLVIEVVNEDTTLDEKTLKAALTELISQMESSSDDVDASTVSVSVAAGGSNTGDGVCVASHKRGDGRPQENMLAESILGKPSTVGLGASVLFETDPLVTGLDHTWPAGSGINKSVTSTLLSASLLANGDMEDEDDATNAPDDWEVVTGVIGTTVKMTDVEVQTIAVSGSPSTGYMWVHWTDPDGNAWTTGPMDPGASAATMQTELRKFKGLEAVTVTVSGTSPNFTYTVTFKGKGGNLAEMTSTETFNVGSIAHATTTQGTSRVFEMGKAVEFDSDGAELTQLRQRVDNLKAETPYAVNLWAQADVVPAGGVFTIDLVDGAGTVIQDSEGVNNSFTFNGSDLSNSAWKDLETLVTSPVVFRLPEVVPDLVYFRLRVSTAISSGTSVFIDGVAMAEMTELYSGGPFAAMFAGSKAFQTNDTFTITATNDRAGGFQEWFQRNFDMASLGLLLPSDTGGAETIADTLIA